MSELRVGVVGVGALGRHHARVYAGLAGVRLVGVHDTDPNRSHEVAALHGCRAFDDLEGLLGEVDAVSVAVPTVHHHRCALPLIEAGRHVLIEKPLAVTRAEAEGLIARAHARGVVLQVGHVERFNPAVDLLFAAAREPRFIEVHRLGVFSPRSLDIDVVLDLMIHDLDILLALDGSDVAQIEAVGVPVLTPKVDIANARIRFASGLIANVTASRVSSQRVRKFRVFAPQLYISVDFAQREARVYRLVREAGGTRLTEERHGSAGQEPLERELRAFVAAIKEGTRPVVSGEDGLRALTLAQAVTAKMLAGMAPSV